MDGLLHWIEDHTIINELLVIWIALLPLAVFWLLSERQLRRPDADEAAHPSTAGGDIRFSLNSGARADIPGPPLWGQKLT